MFDSAEAARELITRRSARNNLLDFTRYTKPDFVAAPHHIKICEILEEIEKKTNDGEESFTIINMPPRHGKTEICLRRFIPYLMGRNANTQIITSTYNGDIATDFGREVRDVINSVEYKKLFNVCVRKDSSAAADWRTDNGCVYLGRGVGEGITGYGAKYLFIDDLIKDSIDANSDRDRENKWKWFINVARPRLMPGGAVIMSNTRWNEDDVPGKCIAAKERGGDDYTVYRFPALAENNDPLGRFLGEALWPEWYSAEKLAKIKNTMPAYDWSALYQQNPVPESGIVCKREWFRFYDKLPLNLSYYMTHDDAVTDAEENPDADYTEIAVWGIDEHGDIYAIDWWSGQKQTSVWINKIIKGIQKYKPSVLIGETGIIRRSVEGLLISQMEKHRSICRLEWLPTIGDKKARCSSFMGLASMGKVYFPKNKQWSTDVIHQLVSFPGHKYDDKVDACGLIGRAINNVFAPTKRAKKKVVKEIIGKPMSLDSFLNDDMRLSRSKKYERQII